MKKVVLLFIIVFSYSAKAQDIDPKIKETILTEVNKIRSKNRHCGRKFMKAVPPLSWNDKLYKSAKNRVSDMHKRRYFSHSSRDGKSFSHRFDSVGYKWREIGENIAMGQRGLKEVLMDWIKSSGHCRMLMNPNVDEMALAKKGKYWVHHFGKQIPEGMVKKNGTIFYKEDLEQ